MGGWWLVACGIIFARDLNSLISSPSEIREKLVPSEIN